MGNANFIYSPLNANPLNANPLNANPLMFWGSPLNANLLITRYLVADYTTNAVALSKSAIG